MAKVNKEPMHTIHACPECGEPHYCGQARQQRIRRDGLRAEICRLLLISECYSTDEAAAEAGEAEDGSGGLG